MKLIIEKHPDSNRLSQLFKKIESIAERNGLDVDELISNTENNKTDNDSFSHKRILSISKKRSDVLFHEDLPDEKFSDRIPFIFFKAED